MERVQSETTPLVTPEGAVTPLPSGLGLSLDWRIL